MFADDVKDAGEENAALLILSLSNLEFAVNEMKKAEVFAQFAKQTLDKHAKNQDVRMMTYSIDLKLGRVALRLGDMARARQYLIKAGTIHKDIPFEGLGPSMGLAKEMLGKERGRSYFSISIYALFLGR